MKQETPLHKHQRPHRPTAAEPVRTEHMRQGHVEKHAGRRHDDPIINENELYNYGIDEHAQDEIQDAVWDYKLRAAMHAVIEALLLGIVLVGFFKAFGSSYHGMQHAAAIWAAISLSALVVFIAVKDD